MELAALSLIMGLIPQSHTEPGQVTTIGGLLNDET